MSDIRPFRGIRPRPDLAPAVAAPPYDVMDYDEARAYVSDKPRSFLRIEKSEIELEKGLATLDPRIFAKGRESLQAWLAEGTLIRDERPCFYLYRQKMGDHVQTGIAAGASVDEYERDLIKKHEHTRQDKEDERTTHVDVVGANTGAVFLTYRADAAIDAFVLKTSARRPDVDFVSDDGIGHTLWVVSAPAEVEELSALFGGVPCLYVADGHHRSAAALRVRQLRAQRGAKPAGQAAYDHFLTVIFPHDQMKIMEYNRVVNDLNGLSPDAFLKRVAEKFEVAQAARPSPEAPRSFGMRLGERWLRLTARPGTFPASDPVDSLDVAILQNNLLGPVLGIADPRTDKRIQFVGGIRGTAELEKRAAKTGGVAFAMYPTSIEQLMAIADANRVMPPKSTWFEPKLRSGMLVRSIED